MFDRVQLTKLLILSLEELGYDESAVVLQKESGGVQVNSGVVMDFLSCIKDGRYSELNVYYLANLPLLSRVEGVGTVLDPVPDRNNSVEKDIIVLNVLLKSMKRVDEEEEDKVCFLTDLVEMLIIVNTQNFLETLIEKGNLQKALTILRRYILELSQIWETLISMSSSRRFEKSRKNFHHRYLIKTFSNFLTTPKEFLIDSKFWNGSLQNSRKLTTNLISEYLDPNFLVPENRLITLLTQAIKYQKFNSLTKRFFENGDDDHDSNMGDEKMNLLKDYESNYHQFQFEEYKSIRQNNNEIWFLQFSPDGKYLASSTADTNSDCKIIIYDVQNDFRISKVLTENEQCILYLSFSPDSRYVVSCPFNEKVNLYDLNASGTKGKLLENTESEVEVDFIPPIDSIVIVNPKKEFSIDNDIDNENSSSSSMNPTPKKMTGNSMRVWCCDWFHTISQYGKLVFGSPDRDVIIYDIFEKTIIYRMSANTEIKTEQFPRIHDIKISWDDKDLILMTHQGYIDIYDISDLPKSKEYEKTALFPSTSSSAVSLLDSTTSFQINNDIKLKRISRLEIDKKMTCISLPNSEKAKTASSSILLVSLQCSELQIWNYRESILIQRFFGQKQQDFIIRSCFGYDNQLVTSGSEDGKIYIWNRALGNIVCVLPAHGPKLPTTLPLSSHYESSDDQQNKKSEKNCNVVVWNPADRSIFASGGDDGILKIWKVTRT